ncbi:MAG: formate transporter FocA [Chloroflexota bacterium]|nr:formate transporter FocA [Chloroflexota bacterium]NOG62441.1 formate transporter FocA [Chloroflexota bacterium]GIK64134.1 MAG: formate transporter FocA [Chloroflexota bacterium]
MNESNGIDALLPPDIAKRAEQVGIKKAGMDAASVFTLALLAGGFVGVGAVFATTTVSGAAGILPYGVTRLLAGVVFSLGLILIVVAGGELFTGNNLIVMAWASRKVSTKALVRNWVLVYAGNFVGAILTAGLMYLTKQYAAGGGAVGKAALNIANDKVHLEFMQAVALGMMCNALVCVAVWLTYGARSTTDKIMAIIFPITAFVSAGFEHSIANMYYIPFALLIKQFDSDFAAAQGLSAPDLTVQSFVIDNLLPVTIGNIIGGSVMVAIIYWFVYLRPQK